MKTKSQAYIEKKGKLKAFACPIYVESPSLEDVRARLGDLCENTPFPNVLFITREQPEPWHYVPVQ